MTRIPDATRLAMPGVRAWLLAARSAAAPVRISGWVGSLFAIACALLLCGSALFFNGQKVDESEVVLNALTIATGDWDTKWTPGYGHLAMYIPAAVLAAVALFLQASGVAASYADGLYVLFADDSAYRIVRVLYALADVLTAFIFASVIVKVTRQRLMAAAYFLYFMMSPETWTYANYVRTDTLVSFFTACAIYFLAVGRGRTRALCGRGGHWCGHRLQVFRGRLRRARRLPSYPERERRACAEETIWHWSLSPWSSHLFRRSSFSRCTTIRESLRLSTSTWRARILRASRAAGGTVESTVAVGARPRATGSPHAAVHARWLAQATTGCAVDPCSGSGHRSFRAFKLRTRLLVDTVRGRIARGGVVWRGLHCADGGCASRAGGGAHGGRRAVRGGDRGRMGKDPNVAASPLRAPEGAVKRGSCEALAVRQRGQSSAGFLCVREELPVFRVRTRSRATMRPPTSRAFSSFIAGDSSPCTTCSSGGCIHTSSPNSAA